MVKKMRKEQMKKEQKIQKVREQIKADLEKNKKFKKAKVFNVKSKNPLDNLFD